MHIHILGICGTFMGGLAALACELGYTVTGSDQNVYPPMSTQLADLGIKINRYSPNNLDPQPDLVLIGNALSRGNPEVEAVLDRGIAYTSGPHWLAEAILKNRWVLAVAGTHGKTTTSSMLAWILEVAKKTPGFLIGGVPHNFARSSRLGKAPFFVVEADEYDSAFFDKRSKFVHYRPRTAILNNLEFDHADIFPDLAAIQLQFHYFVRTVPSNGCLIVPARDSNLQAVLARGCWTPVERFAIEDNACDWSACLHAEDGSRFEVFHQGKRVGSVSWSLVGRHNVANALAAAAAAYQVGIDPELACSALARFKGVRRRLELRGEVGGVAVYDDFAHHPTAIAATLEGMRARIGNQRLIAVVEPRSNTMRMGIHASSLAPSMAAADLAFVYAAPDLPWNTTSLAAGSPSLRVFHDLKDLVSTLTDLAQPGDHIVFMSNGSFGNICALTLEKLRYRLV